MLTATVADVFRVLSTPVQPAGGAPVDQLAALVAADALCRWARGKGYVVHWRPSVIASDLAGQHAAERELARSGFDRASLERDEFVARVRAQEAADRARLSAVLSSLVVDADVELGVIDRDEVAAAARTAFVRLFEEGRVVNDERIVRTCARCGSVVDEADAEHAELAVEASVVEVPCGGGSLRLRLIEPELLPGAVAVVVPDSHPCAGGEATVPLAPGPLPIVVGDVDEPAVLVPGHRPQDLATARQLGLAAIEVLDASGHVVSPGPLEGLARFAAREAAIAHLDSEGVLAGREAATEDAARCRRCGSVLVSRLGRHCFLAMADLEVAAADAVRQGDVEVAPPDAREEFLARAGQGGDWCLSNNLPAGQPVPVARCLDCGKVNVAVEIGGTCGMCMGTLEADGAVLDARFVAVVAALADAGWPGSPSDAAALGRGTVLVTPAGAVAQWALPIAALGLRLSGTVPFGRLAVQDRVQLGADDDEVAAGVVTAGARATRLALAGGGLTLEEAVGFVELVERPVPGDADLDATADDVDTAFELGMVAAAAHALVAAARAGVATDDGERLRRLAAPLMGE